MAGGICQAFVFDRQRRQRRRRRRRSRDGDVEMTGLERSSRKEGEGGEGVEVIYVHGRRAKACQLQQRRTRREEDGAIQPRRSKWKEYLSFPSQQLAG